MKKKKRLLKYEDTVSRIFLQTILNNPSQVINVELDRLKSQSNICNFNKFKDTEGSMEFSFQNLAIYYTIYRRLFFAFAIGNPSCILGKNLMETS